MTDTFDNRQASLALTQAIITNGIYPDRDTGGVGGPDTTIASLRTFAFNYSPDIRGMADGHLLPINQYAALYSLIGNTYGGDGRTTFGVPNLQGRVLVGAGSPDAVTLPVGQAVGTTASTLTMGQLPSSVGGGNQPFSNLQPALSVFYGIQTAGDGFATYTGEVDAFAEFYFIPNGYIPADGRLLSVSQYQSLFSVIGARYGGDGITTFAVPNLVGRDIIGTGADASSTLVSLGQVVGNSNPVLTPGQLPSTAIGGAGAVVDNRAAGLGLNYAIAVRGIFPPRDSNIPDGEVILGEVRAFAGAIPDGWIAANGQTLGIQQNAALYSLLGTAYGGNGQTTFNLPNLSNRVVVGTGVSAADGQTYTIGGVYGVNSIQLTTTEIPDATAPVITLTAPAAAIEAASARGAVVAFSAAASDNLDRNTPVVTFKDTVNGVTKTVASGDTFAIGAHSIVALATDAHGNVATRTFAFTVVDRTAPTITFTAPIGTVNSTTNAGVAVTFTAAAADAVDGTNPVTVTENGARVTSGSTFAVGQHTLTATAVDAANNTSSVTRTFTVVDATSPQAVSIVPSVTTNTAATFTEIVTFSEAVTGVTADDFTVAGTGSASARVAAVTGSGSTYTVTLDQVAGNGTLRLDLKATGTGIQDIAGNAIGGGFTGTSATTLDHTAPLAPGVTLARDTGFSATDRVTSDATVVIVPAEVGGSLRYAVDGVIVAGYDSATLSQGAHTLTVSQVDATGNVSADGVLSFTLDTLAPVTVADALTTLGTKAPLIGNVLANDTDASALHLVGVNGAPLGSSLDLAGRHGTLHLAADGAFHYQPTSVGADQFVYRVEDVAGNASEQTLSFDVRGAPQDAVSDLIFRNPDTGLFTKWQADGNGFHKNAYVDGSVPTDWTLEAVSDFNGDGKADLLWRQAGGTFTEWQSTGTGYTPNTYRNAGVGTDWQVAGTGDFDGDGRADILWKNATTGVITEWQSTGTGFIPNTYVGGVDKGLHLQAIADFNGDGRADLLWRDAGGAFSEWQSTGTGFTRDVYVDRSVGTDWHVAGTGDFNGDGKADLLWRHAQGTFSEWQSTGNGFTPNTYVDGSVSTAWQIAQVSDFNGDGKADLLFSNATAHVITQWQSTGDGFTLNTYVDGHPPSAVLQHHQYDLV